MEPLSLDTLQRQYQTILTNVRICQLYAFLLLLEILTQLLAFPLTAVFAALGMIASALADTSPVPIEWPDLHFRSVMEILYLANVWLLLRVFADCKRAYWVLAFCAVGLTHNVWVTHESLFLRDGGGFEMTADGVDLAQENAFARYLFFAAIVATHLMFMWIAIRGQRVIHTLNHSEAHALSEFRPAANKWSAALLTLLNIPVTIRYSRRRVWTALLQIFSGLKNFLNYWVLMMLLIVASVGPAIASIAAEPLRIVWHNVRQAGLSSQSVTALALLSLVAFVSILFFSALPFLVHLLGKVALVLARKTMRRSLHDIQGEDDRAPILFLRSFLDDQVLLKPRRWNLLQWVLDETSRSITLDYLLLTEGTQYGPTVALGNPDDPAPPYGVARGYFEHATWKSAVGELCDCSVAIVMVLDTTVGVEWEFDHIVRQEHQAKTLFLLAPGDVGHARGEALLRKALGACGADPETLFESVQGTQQIVGFCQPQRGRADGRALQLLTTSALSAYSYVVAVRRFLRTLLEN